MQYEVLSGRSFPLGVTLESGGANVAVFSAHAEHLDLCLFDSRRAPDRAASGCRKSPTKSFTASCLASRLSKYTVCGPMVPGPRSAAAGSIRNRLLLDPYARALTGRFHWTGPNIVDPVDPLALDPRDNAHLVPKGVMTAANSRPRPKGRTRPGRETVLYEAHVRGHDDATSRAYLRRCGAPIWASRIPRSWIISSA